MAHARPHARAVPDRRHRVRAAVGFDAGMRRSPGGERRPLDAVHYLTLLPDDGSGRGDARGVLRARPRARARSVDSTSTAARCCRDRSGCSTASPRRGCSSAPKRCRSARTAGSTSSSKTPVRPTPPSTNEPSWSVPGVAGLWTFGPASRRMRPVEAGRSAHHGLPGSTTTPSPSRTRARADRDVGRDVRRFVNLRADRSRRSRRGNGPGSTPT